jgi:hypothetical protein
MNAHLDSCLNLEMVRGDTEKRDFDIKKDLPQLQQILEDRSDIGAVVIEPVVAFVNPKDGNAEPEIRRKLRPLAKLAQQYQVAVIGINAFPQGRRRGRGSPWPGLASAKPLVRGVVLATLLRGGKEAISLR